MARYALHIKMTFNDQSVRDYMAEWYQNQYNNWFAVQKSAPLTFTTADDVENDLYSMRAICFLPLEADCDEVLAFMTLPGGIGDPDLDSVFVHDESTAWKHACDKDEIDIDCVEEVLYQWVAP